MDGARQSRCVGLLGGVGVGAAKHYYGELARACEARGVELDLVMVNADTPRVLKYVAAEDREGLAAYLGEALARMKSAGAEAAVIPSVTTHYSIDELRRSAPLPVLDIFAPLAAEVARRSIRRVTVFGTRFVMQSNLYGRIPGLDFVSPQAEEMERIHETYLEIALKGAGTRQQFEELRDLALRLVERDHLDAIVLGGTDLSLIFNESNMDFPHLDCAALHVKSVADAVVI